MRKKSFMQIGGLMGFVLLLLVISYIIIHRDAKNIKRYKRKTTDLIEQLEQSGYFGGGHPHIVTGYADRLVLYDDYVTFHGFSF